MAKRRSILNKLTDVDDQTDTPSPTPEQDSTDHSAPTLSTENTEPPPSKATAKAPARRRNTAKTTTRGEEKGTGSGQSGDPGTSRNQAQTANPVDNSEPEERKSQQQSSRSRGNSGARSTTSGRSTPERAAREQRMAQLIPYPEGEEAERFKRDPSGAVRVPTTEEAKRVGFYLHAEDHRDLTFAKTIDGADANTRVRAMIAYWRTNKQFRDAVNRTASAMPRGPWKNQTGTT